MKNELHVVLGGSGAIGRAVIAELQVRKKLVRAVERAKHVNDIDTINADLLDSRQAVSVMNGATHVYICVGLQYNSKIWDSDWPIIMKNIIDACAISNAKLIFFDNVYMYGPSPLDVPFSESHRQEPTTRKGLVRKQIADMLMNAQKSGRVSALIGRSADFYGPGAINSVLYTKCIENMVAGKNPQIISKPGIQHTYAYTIDNGRALVELALDDKSYGQVWHLPVGKPVSIDDIITVVNSIMGTNFKASYMPRPILGLVSLFVPIISEVKEMLYQFDEPYIMSDEKFMTAYPRFITTSYEDGLKSTINSFNNFK